METFHWKWIALSLSIHSLFAVSIVTSNALLQPSQKAFSVSVPATVSVSLKPAAPKQVSRAVTASSPAVEAQKQVASNPEISSNSATFGSSSPVSESADRLPVFLTPFRSDYPESARQQGIEGDVTLIVTLDEEGHVENVEVLKSSHPLLGTEAVQAMKKAGFSPALSGGKPVRFRFTYKVVFSL